VPRDKRHEGVSVAAAIGDLARIWVSRDALGAFTPRPVISQVSPVVPASHFWPIAN